MNHLFSTRWAARLDPSTVQFLTHPISNVTLQTYQSLISLPISYHHTLKIHQAWIHMTLSKTQFFIPSHNLTIETPDEFENSEPSPSIFSQPPFRPLHTPTPDEPSPVPSYYTDASPIFSPMTSDPPEPLAPWWRNRKWNWQFYKPTTTTLKP